MLEVVARIARAVRVPVTADMEAGYGTTLADMAKTAKAIVDAGAVGLNLEDVTGETESSQVNIELQAQEIGTIRETSASLGGCLVINARTDIYLMPLGPEATRFARPARRPRGHRTPRPAC